MTHDPRFWADKLPFEPIDCLRLFWFLVESGFSGESAYYKTCNKFGIKE